MVSLTPDERIDLALDQIREAVLELTQAAVDKSWQENLEIDQEQNEPAEAVA